MASLANSGQVCDALSRILVPAAREAEFVDALAAAMAAMPVGDPADPNTAIGPLVAQRQQERVRGYIEAGKSEGARLVVGGSEMPDGLDTGWYVKPTLFSAAHNDMRIAREEIFGPVLTVIPYRDATRRSGSPTTPSTGWPVQCSPPTSNADTGLRRRCDRERSA